MPGWPEDGSPYHEGERALQLRLGVRERAEQMGQRVIRDFMPEQHMALYRALPSIFVGSLDPDGRPWASLLVGAPGFVHAPDPYTLHIGAHPRRSDPLSAALASGAPLGVLGIQLESRRRNRVNGRVRDLDDRGFSIRVDQSFGNCPKYINARTSCAFARTAGAPEHEQSLLSSAALDCIAASDTCFVASAFGRDGGSCASQGVDVSHRGGRPGFVRARSDGGATVLTLPDFAGNNAFNTLGNIVQYPRAGLLFVDFASGDTLQLTGRARLILEGEQRAQFRGAERLVELVVEQGVRSPRAVPLRWSDVELAVQHDKTGAWSDPPARS